MGLNDYSNALNSREKPAVSPMSGSPTFDTGKKQKQGELKLRHALRAGEVTKQCLPMLAFTWLRNFGLRRTNLYFMLLLA